MKPNVWYVIGKKDDTSPYGYSQVTPKGQYFNTLPEAKEALSRTQEIFEHGNEFVIFKRTCQVIK